MSTANPTMKPTEARGGTAGAVGKGMAGNVFQNFQVGKCTAARGKARGST